jgi:hypothetical protein
MTTCLMWSNIILFLSVRDTFQNIEEPQSHSSKAQKADVEYIKIGW